jgi:hypothetical protein
MKIGIQADAAAGFACTASARPWSQNVAPIFSGGMRLKLALSVTMLGIIGVTAAQAADPLLASIAGMTCKGSFSSSVTNSRTTQGAIWMVVGPDGTSITERWRKWGREALANPKPTTRDAEYESLPPVTLAAKNGKIVFASTTGGTTFHWELTPTSVPASFTMKVTGGQFGTEGSLDCSK